MDQKQAKVAKGVVYLQQEVNNRFTTLLSEEILRKGISSDRLDTFKESILYVLEEQIRFIKNDMK